MLSPEQVTARRGKLTGSRVGVLMHPDPGGVKHTKLWLELMGDPAFVPEDLSRVWPVQRGANSEPLNLRWYEMKNNIVLLSMGAVLIHPDYPWAAATLDAWDDNNKCPVECKDTNGNEPLEVVAERAQPQMQWQCFVTGAKECALSVILGGREPLVDYYPRADDYIAEMLSRAKQFMGHVWNKTPPVILPPVPAPIVAEAIYDMSDNETWARYGQQWLQVKGAAESARECEKILKSIVPEDAKKCHGFGIQITRDRVGRLSLREATQ